MTDEFPCTELDVAGTFFDAEHLLRLVEARQVGLWMWEEEWQPYQMVMGSNRKTAPIAEGGREIIEQAKEEAFLAWGL